MQLTGLGNRRALEEAFDRLRGTSPSKGLSAVLIMIDLDYFKEINDKYGHNAGDQILIDVGKMLQRITRPEDICIRYGGEEFAILLRTKNIDMAVELAERIRKEFSETPTIYERQSISHTLTAGLTKPFTPDEKIIPTELVQQADIALYRAKESGRNQTLVYT
ncbi:GGDEF domain-containing protein [Thiohalophilus sp.]|uniref:GGDEF domain-containing protein n=1 Tax=Thiohalophilus sp. TaxID=3028392 RepID=UPI002ACD6AC2|nr:GGDEF domain-containing protein [Thiohalophilus sp.]MDZ7803264.1 GGDEF domain-containing protein [Thiohalophilus sp.]